jgi:hypothetical protein
MNFKVFQISSVYTIWDGLSLKTISRYCPFKLLRAPGCNKGPTSIGDKKYKSATNLSVKSIGFRPKTACYPLG